MDAMIFHRNHANHLRLLNIANSHRYQDKGIYFSDKLVGAVIQCEDHWCVWKIDETGSIDNLSQFSSYQQQMEQQGQYRTFSEAKVYVHGPFEKKILNQSAKCAG